MSDSNDKSKKNQSTNSDDETRTFHPNTSGFNLESHHPKKIGQYLIKRVIASGGMGTVFEGLQENPKRPVAVKVIKSSLADESAVRRLEYEAQLLAHLRHPGIAQIYEAGSYDDNGNQTPFFAMEYIPNAKTITEYSLENNLNSQSKIELFLQVCDAIHHGHQRGIVHRDLKPSNILVDSSGRVRIIDFGVARATDVDMKQAEGLTNYGQIVGTVQYMSPEQFDADPHDIDIRSDVYALGLILYQLLTGSLPYTSSSEKIFDFASEVREGRAIPISSKNSSFKGDLEAIVQKAMHRDREHRYQSAFGLAQDIRRFVNGDAVVATRPGLGYQMKIFARKNKAIIGLVGAAFIILLISVVVTSSLLVKVDKEKEVAEIAKQKATEGQQFLSDVLTASFPWGYGDKVTVANILDRASSKLNGAFSEDPEIEGELRNSLGLAYAKIGHYEQAERELDIALKLHIKTFGISHDKTLSILDMIGRMYFITGNMTEEIRIQELNIKAITERFGESDIRTLEAKEITASSYEYVGRISEAISLEKEVWEIFLEKFGKDSSATISAQIQYSWLLLKNGNVELAEELCKEAYELTLKIKTDEHDLNKDAISCLAGIYIVQSKIDEAKKLYNNKKIPESFGVEKVFQGEFDLNRKPYQLLVFFETWCPYSKLALKDLGEINNQYNKLGLDIIGFTTVTKNAVDADVDPFLKELGAEFTVVKENGRTWNYFNCEATPSIRLLYNGFVIWEMRYYSNEVISTQVLEGIVEAQACGAFR